MANRRTAENFSNAFANIGDIVAGGIKEKQQKDQLLNIGLQKYFAGMIKENQLKSIQQKDDQIINDVLSNGADPLKALPGLSKEGLDKLSKIKSLQPKPKEEKRKNVYDDVKGKIFSINEDNPEDMKEYDAPYLIKPKEVKPEKVYLRTQYDPNTDSYYDLQGYKTEDGKEVIIDRQNAGKRTKTDESGNVVFTSSAKKLFKDYYNEQQKLLAEKQIGEGFGLDDHNKKYTALVKNSMTEKANEWYQSLYNSEFKDTATNEVLKKAKSNAAPKDFWDSLVDSYANGEFDTSGTKGKKEKDEVLTYQTLLELFKATYGFDPLEVYGIPGQ